ncbi:glycoside hydrolase family 127 protein [Roseimarinus sediminis]|uniref:glycoside hydrolase family 127 protein n=1 Tax=Roseimarinus sediminis TaxID=1610899 RepID=UPI003D1B4116
MRIYYLILLSLSLLIVSCTGKKTEQKNVADYAISGIPFNEVQITDHFWLPKIETNRTVTIPASFAKCEEMGRMDNFLIAGGVMEGKTKGEMPFDDTDVYKIIEGASYSLSTHPDRELDAYVDSIIAIIKTGQEKDGYLTTWKTIDPTVSPASWAPPGERWENLATSHELYNSGHLFEAAAAHYRATGKTNLLDIATKNADLLVRVFGKGQLEQVPGHQIVETGLIKLYLLTHKKEYLDLAKYFLDTRGNSSIRETWGPYNQDHIPVIQQEEAVGHAVRAAYMYAGMTDIAALFNDSSYTNAVDKIWENVVNKKLYITGGIGSRHEGEAFGENYELPNLTAYNETCAAIANVYWNYRMFLLHGESKYIDVLERSLYNGVISGVGIDGKTFFYPNPLECDMHYHFNSGGSLTREPWFDCSCCPSNMCRFMPSIPGYVYAQDSGNVYVNLFVQSTTTVNPNGIPVQLELSTNYPWEGTIKLAVNPASEHEFAVRLRVPAWLGKQPVSGDLYTYLDELHDDFSLKVNGESVSFTEENGYAVIKRQWNMGDVIEYQLPMEVRKVKANDKVKDNRGKIAIERGPVVYCVEGADNPEIDQLSLSCHTSFAVTLEESLLGGVTVLNAQATNPHEQFRAIPYYVWNNRGANKMKVWLKAKCQ